MIVSFLSLLKLILNNRFKFKLNRIKSPTYSRSGNSFPFDNLGFLSFYKLLE